ncbi:hypothetical protein MSG28_015210 [Choristoneura fumiferana]|uniref:Uncharacterized protein n=2 Tax=Choristoneura fumiferana TaxID=7141 RepID=A0ACC0KYW4_CHOFU|nr:hypothetical protein MSG28_015210 [Choristoneura fumiferana]KAI8441659.1 hypothetical protein MSG28_015210 [Choristoneura fumiferana]
MNNLQISSPVETRPKHLAVTKFSSTLMSTTDHPLMGIASPDENYPDLIPKKYKEDEKDLSLSSIEDERTNETNEYFYSPQRNTSKNNLYFNENFITAESHILSTTLDVTSPPDVARGIEKRKRFEKETPRLSRVGLEDLDSPDVISSSQEDRSAYQALLDPYTGSVMLRHTPAKSPGGQRRRIQLRVVSHGGYDGAGAALIVFSACHLPDSARADYHYVRDLDAGAARDRRVRAGVPVRERRPAPPAHRALAQGVLQAGRPPVKEKSEAPVPGASHLRLETLRYLH